MGESTWSTWNYCASRHRHLATALLQVNEVSESFQTTNALALLCKSGKRQTKPKTVKVESHKKTMLFARGSFSSNLYPTYLLTYSCVLAACSSYKRYSKPSCPNVGFSFTYYVNMTQTMAKGQGAPFRLPPPPRGKKAHFIHGTVTWSGADRTAWLGSAV